MQKKDNDILELLNDNDINILCENCDLNMLISPIKHNSKKYAKYVKFLGNMDKKSQLVQMNMPKFAYELFRKSDSNYIKLLSQYGNQIKNNFEQILNDAFGDEFSPKDLAKYTIIEYHSLFETILRGTDCHLDLELFFVQMKMFGYDIDEAIKLEINKEFTYVSEVEKIRTDILRNQKQEIQIMKSDLENQFHEQINDKNKTIKQLKLENVELKKKSEIQKDSIEKLSEEMDRLNSEASTALKSTDNQLNEKKTEIQKSKIYIEELVKDIEELKIMLNDKSEKYFDELSMRWESENQDKMYDRLVLEEHISEFEVQIKELEEIISNKESLLEKWNYSIENFYGEIDKKIIEHRIESKLFSDYALATNETNSAQKILSQGGSAFVLKGQTGLDNESCKDVDEYFEIVENNLTNIGVKMPERTISHCFNAAINVNLVPLICGYNARKIALALIAARYGEIPEIISLPIGFSNSIELIDMIKRAETKTIIVEDAFGTMNENVLLPYLRNVLIYEKKVVFTTEGATELKYLPMHFFNYIKLIVSTKMINKSVKTLRYADADNLFLSADYTGKEIGHKLSRQLLESIGMGDGYVSTRGNLLCELFKFQPEQNHVLMIYIITELKWIMNNEQKQAFEDLLSSNTDLFSSELLKLIR
ncbi:MAG: hypothetical protein CVV02_03910 [Firmicutes bacterium HGW-Firmicutes-7]|nr:MAG: hypothetical protein CVV02_03910 [Firmicutes bacterium HGW-Firmicutes-7]